MGILDHDRVRGNGRPSAATICWCGSWRWPPPQQAPSTTDAAVQTDLTLEQECLPGSCDGGRRKGVREGQVPRRRQDLGHAPQQGCAGAGGEQVPHNRPDAACDPGWTTVQGNQAAKGRQRAWTKWDWAEWSRSKMAAEYEKNEQTRKMDVARQAAAVRLQACMRGWIARQKMRRSSASAVGLADSPVLQLICKKRKNN